ncbi:MAG TPA: rod shape-determining protein MreD [Terriglobales bacterium]|nr:rod shape-determining protein MreD [Terriglobales bacterium]
MRETVLRDAVRAALATLAAFAFYALIGGARPSVLIAVNAFAIVVVTFSVGRDEVFGAVLGAVCGLIQDSFSLGVFGVAGLTKTLLGFGTGYISRRFDVGAFFRNALFLLFMSSLELVLWLLLEGLVLREPVDFRRGLLALQPFVTALVGSLILHVERRARRRRG